MSTRRFRLCLVKNQERRKRKHLLLVVSIPRHRIHVVGMVVCDERVPKHESPEPSLAASLPVSFPLSVFKDLKTSSSNELGRRLQMLSFPPSWVIASLIPLTLCKMQVQDVMKPIVLMSVVVKDEMVWAVRILNSTFDINNFPMVNNIPPKLFSVSDVLNLVNVLDLSKFCIGNPDFSMVEHWHQKRYSYNGTLHACKSM